MTLVSFASKLMALRDSMPANHSQLHNFHVSTAPGGFPNTVYLYAKLQAGTLQGVHTKLYKYRIKLDDTFHVYEVCEWDNDPTTWVVVPTKNGLPPDAAQVLEDIRNAYLLLA